MSDTNNPAIRRVEIALAVLGTAAGAVVATPALWRLLTELWEIGSAFFAAGTSLVVIVVHLGVLVIVAGVSAVFTVALGALLGLPSYRGLRDRFTGRAVPSEDNVAA